MQWRHAYHLSARQRKKGLFSLCILMPWGHNHVWLQGKLSADSPQSNSFLGERSLGHDSPQLSPRGSHSLRLPQGKKQEAEGTIHHLWWRPSSTCLLLLLNCTSGHYRNTYLEITAWVVVVVVVVDLVCVWNLDDQICASLALQRILFTNVLCLRH